MSRLNGLVFDSRVQASLITMCLIIFLVFVGSAIAQPGGRRAEECYRQLGSMLLKDGERGKDAR